MRFIRCNVISRLPPTACLHVACVVQQKDARQWFAELSVDMDKVRTTSAALSKIRVSVVESELLKFKTHPRVSLTHRSVSFDVTFYFVKRNQNQTRQSAPSREVTVRNLSLFKAAQCSVSHLLVPLLISSHHLARG